MSLLGRGLLSHGSLLVIVSSNWSNEKGDKKTGYEEEDTIRQEMSGNRRKKTRHEKRKDTNRHMRRGRTQKSRI